MVEKREWNDDEVMQLINMYEEHDFLWNMQHSMYRNRDKKKVAFDEFAKQFSNCDGNEVQRKIHNLRNQLSHEMQKVKKCKSGDGIEKRYNSKWKFFTALQFISPSFTTRTTSNINKTHNNIDIAQDDQTEDESTTIRRRTAYKRTSQTLQDDDAFKEAINNIKKIKKEKDDFDRFGEYVALELRNLKSDFYRGQLKSAIRKAIVQVSDLDEEMYWSGMSSYANSSTTEVNPHSSSKPSTDSSSPPSPVVRTYPTYIPVDSPVSGNDTEPIEHL